jgi:hypothetical protein
VTAAPPPGDSSGGENRVLWRSRHVAPKVAAIHLLSARGFLRAGWAASWWREPQTIAGKERRKRPLNQLSADGLFHAATASIRNLACQHPMCSGCQSEGFETRS